MKQPYERIFIGIDVGTSAVRALAIDEQRCELALAEQHFGDADRRNCRHWWSATTNALDALLAQIDRHAVAALAVDGTSGTMLPVDRNGEPLAPAKLYNDRCESAELIERIADAAPADAAVHGASSALARLLEFSAVDGAALILHEADWISSRLSGVVGVSDENNSLKTGYDALARRWPDWLADAGANTSLLPRVVEPGTPIGPLSPAAAKRFELPRHTVVVAGTTDGCASFLATGAEQLGDGVSVLGSTLTIKLLSAHPITAPQYGIYSHRIGDLWLAGGASNSGGAALQQFFSPRQLAELSARINTDTSSGLDYYPLPRRGERFPSNDPQLEPRVTPRPTDDVQFLQGLLEGIAAIEASGYARLAELGGPALTSLRSVGGGANNRAWTDIRQRQLGVPMQPALSSQAAAGTARLAILGAQR